MELGLKRDQNKLPVNKMVINTPHIIGKKNESH